MSAIAELARKNYQEATPTEKLIIMSWSDREMSMLSEDAATEYATLQARISELEIIEAAAKRWRNKWPDEGDLRELESGCRCEVCCLIRAVDGAK